MEIEEHSFLSWRELVVTPIVQSTIILAALGCTQAIEAHVHVGLLGDIFIFYGILVVLTLMVLRGMITVFPFREGKFYIKSNPWAYYWWSLYGYLYITHLYVLYQNILIPPMFRAPIYRMLGAKIAPGLISINAVITDPSLLEIGKNVIIGEGSLIAGHLTTRPGHFILKKVVLESGVLIGARSIILPGAHIGSGALIRIGSVVYPNTVIPAGETWGGNPAIKIEPPTKGPQSSDVGTVLTLTSRKSETELRFK